MKKNQLKLNLQYFGGGQTLFELKQNMTTIGQQLQKVEGELAQTAMDTSATLEDIQKLQNSKSDLQARFDVVKDQHDRMEAEQKAQFQQNKVSFDGLDKEQKLVKAKAEVIRAAIEGREVSTDAKQLIAIPKGDPSGGDKLLPTTMAKDIVHEPFAKNQLRELGEISSIKGLELPKLSYQLDDDDFIGDDETAKEIKLTGDTVQFGRNKFKVMVSIPDTVIYGTDIELVNYVENALRSGLAAKEKKDALADEPKAGLEHMSFYTDDVKKVSGSDLYATIKKAIADLHEDFRDNAKILMNYADYMDIIDDLANKNRDFYSAQPEQVLGKPVEFADDAKNPIVGDFNYFRINYDQIVYDSDKDVKTGNFLFVLTAWYDQKRSLNTPFRVVEIESGN